MSLLSFAKLQTSLLTYLSTFDNIVSNEMELKMKNKLTFKVYTQERIETGQNPLVVYGASVRSVTNRWIKKYHQTPVKVIPCVWDLNSGTFVEKEQ